MFSLSASAYTRIARGIARMKILVGRRKRDPPKLQMIPGGPESSNAEPSVLVPGKPNQLLREPIDILRNVGVGNLGLKIFAFKPQDDGFIHQRRLRPMMVRIGRR